MDLSPNLQSILDYSRAEAKRSGQSLVEPIHVAAALIRAHPDRLESEYGENAKELIFSALNKKEKSYGESSESSEVTKLLESADDADDPLGSIIDALRGLLGGSEPAPPTTTVKPPENEQVENVATETTGAAREQAPAPEEAPSISVHVPSNLDRFVEVVEPNPNIVGRDATVNVLISMMGQRQPECPLVVGGSGSGKSSLFAALAARIQEPQYSGPLAGMTILRIKATAIVAHERSHTLRQLVRELDPSAILLIDDLEVLASLGGANADLLALGVVRGMIGDKSRPSAVAIGTAYVSKLEVCDAELFYKLKRVDLPDLVDSDLEAIGKQRIKGLEEFHNVTIEPVALAAALRAPAKKDVRMHPALMLDRLDLACTRAAMRDDRTATAQDVAHDEKEEAIPHFDGDLAIKQLGKRVIGQDQAIEGIVSRLTLTRANLDIQPVRPDGVFLFVGPTGVGKTELARALAETVYGTEDACIRLDMSEYAHDWALSRLLGPQPGYVGYTEPEGWLTTQVRERPQSLILLDEVEKAHPTIWNAFLQVFDAGRLTDARGNVAIFSDSIVIMTSNLGSENFRSNPIGFSADLDGGSEQKAGQTIDAVKGAMPPELINRLDDVIVFNALSREVIKMIASSSISTALQRLKSNGFDLTCTDEAIEFIADQGYDPAYGARHLQRNIERHLLQSLVKHGPGRLEAVLNEGAIEWVTVEM